MLSSIPPFVSQYGTYDISETCAILGCCRDTLRKRTESGQIRSSRLAEDTEKRVYHASEILRYWFAATRQPKTDGEINVLLKSLRDKGYEATFGCKPPIIKKKQSKSAASKT